MSFLDECKKAQDPWKVEGINENSLVHAELVEQTRWGVRIREVWERDGEYVECMYEVGSGDSDIDYEPEFKTVKPETRTVTVYV